ncbi:hypothetical protein ACHAXH_006678 [Discostella pseudostelligera]
MRLVAMSAYEDHPLLSGSGDDGNDSETGSVNVKRREVGNRAFDIETFHQLRLEMLENQRKAEQERRQRHVLRSSICLDVGSTSRSPSSVVSFPPSSTDITHIPKIMQGDTFRASICAKGINDDKTSSARQELLRLGRRYATTQESLSMSTQTNRLSSLDLTRSFDGNSRPTTFLQKLCPHDDTNMHVSALDHRSSTLGIGTHGVHYLLLARTTSLPNHDHTDNNVIDDEDESASESYSTPMPQLQTAMDDDAFYDQQDDKKLDHFESLCAAQMLLADMDNRSNQPKEEPMNLREADHDDFVQQRTRMDRGIKCFIKVSLIVLVGIAIFFCWSYTLDRYRQTHTHFNSTLVSVQYSVYIQSMQLKYLSMQTRFENRVDQLFSLLKYLTPHSLSWVKKPRWRNPVRIYTEWRQDIDWLSYIIKNLYRLQKVYRDAIRLAFATKYIILGAHRSAVTIFYASKHSFLEARQVPAVAWNATLTLTASVSWSSMNSSRRFEPQQIWRSTHTSPLLYWSVDEVGSTLSRNDTMMWLVDDAEVAKPVIGSRFWRKSITLPFLRITNLPLHRRNFIHSIPSFAAVQWPSDLNKSDYSYPLILLSRPRLTLNNPRLDSIAISLDIRKNVAASIIMQKTRPPKQCNNSQAIARTLKRDYYESSYSFEEGQAEGKDVFEDVDVMNMAHEFVGKVLQRRSRKNKRIKDDSGETLRILG